MERPDTALDQRTNAQADSLQLRGFFIIPQARSLSPTTNTSFMSQRVRRCQLSSSASTRMTTAVRGTYTTLNSTVCLHLPSSIVTAVANEADGDKLVFRDQSVRVSFCDGQRPPSRCRRRRGRLRSGLCRRAIRPAAAGHPAALRSSSSSAGSCYSHDPSCAYYQYKVSFALSGTYIGGIFYFDTTALAQVGSELEFEVKGLAT